MDSKFREHLMKAPSQFLLPAVASNKILYASLRLRRRQSFRPGIDAVSKLDIETRFFKALLPFSSGP